MLKEVAKLPAKNNLNEKPSFKFFYLGRLLKDGQGKLQNEVYMLRPQILMRGAHILLHTLRERDG